MKKIGLIAISLAAAALSLNAADIRPSMNLGVGYLAYQLDYTEKGSEGTISKDSSVLGEIGGVDVFGDFIINDGLIFGNSNYLKIDYQRYSGNSKYIGSTSGGNFGDVKNVNKNTIMDFDALLTENIIKKNYGLYAGVGLGYHTWDREYSDIQTEKYSWINLIAEAGGSYKIFNALEIGARVGYKAGISPKMVLDSQVGKLTFDMGNIHTLYAGVPIQIHINDSFSLYSEYKYEYVDVSSGGTNNNIQDPASENMSNKLTVGLSMHFK